MNRIISKTKLSDNVYKMQLEAPLVAQERKAGQFVILMADDEFGERIPLTIADADVEKGTITVIFQTVGATTTKLSRLEPGDSIAALLGPLGRPTSIRGENGEKPGHVVCVGGGISGEGDALIEMIIDTIRKEQYGTGFVELTKVCIAELGNDAGIIGAAFLGI